MAALLAALLALATSAHALTLEYTWFAASGGTSVGDTGTTSVTTASPFFAEASHGGSELRMRVEPGRIQGEGAIQWPVPDPSDPTAAVREVAIQARLFDDITFFAPAGSTTAGGTPVFNFQIDGQLDQQNGFVRFFSQADLIARFGAPVFRGTTSGQDSPRFGRIGDPLGVAVSSAPYPAGAANYVPFGQMMTLQWFFVLTLNQGDSDLALEGSALGDLFNTATWLGITFVDEAGAPIEGVQAMASGDYDWMNPPPQVPLPATAWLVLMGVGSIGLLRLRGAARAKELPAP